MRSKVLFSFSVVLFTIMVLLPCCSKDDENNAKPLTNAHSKVVVIDTAVISKKLDSITDAGTLKFTGLTESEIPSKGDIICSPPTTNAPLGFLYKVRDIVKTGKTTTITTDIASVEEAVENTDITKSINITDYITRVYDENGETIPSSKVITKFQGSNGINITVDHTVKLNNNISCVLKGSIASQIVLFFDISIKEWKLQGLELSIEPQLKSSITASIEGTLKDSVTFNLANFKIAPIVFWAGPVPIVINPVLSLDILVSAEGKVAFTAKIIDIDLSYKAGIKYQENNFSLINENGFNPVKILEDIELSLNGAVKLEPQLRSNFKIYNQNSYAGIKTSIYAELSTDDIILNPQILYGQEAFNPKMRLETGIKLGPEAKLQVFSKEIAQWKPSINLVKWTLWERAVFPMLSNVSFENVTITSVLVKCEVEKLAIFLFKTSQHGFCWSTEVYPELNTSESSQLGEINNFNTFGKQSMSTQIDGLKYNTTYTIRPYFTNWLGTFYASGETIKTLDLNIPTVETSPVTVKTSNSAIVGGNVTYSGGGEVLECGVYWSTSPSDYGTKIQIGNNAGQFSKNLTGLTPNTTYFVRAYATNSKGIAYGTLISFTTQQNISIPTVTSSAAINITSSSALLGGNVTHDGNSTVTDRGVVYSTSQNPTITSNIISAGNGKGSFSVNLSNLESNTKYYFRAYAINVQGTAYGSELNFSTISSITTPEITTSDPINITENGVTLGGNVISSGGATVFERGIVYSSSQNPTTDHIKILSGSGTGTFTVNISSLTPNSLYYARAYAINSIGTSYGNEISFVTLSASSPSYPGTTLHSVSVNNIWWAPVNCGYNQESLTYGLLYQWHRKYGQDYVTTGITSGPVSLSIGNDINNINLMFINAASWNWCDTEYSTWDISTGYNPCPAGWRLPTESELNYLTGLGDTFTNTGVDGLPGKWIGGNHATDHSASLFFPFSGSRLGTTGLPYNRGVWGYYWSSESAGSSGKGLLLSSGIMSMGTSGKQSGFSVRCVKD